MGGGGGHKKPVYRYIGGIFYKEGTVESFQNQGGLDEKEEGGVFEGRVHTPMHTMGSKGDTQERLIYAKLITIGIRLVFTIII